MISQYLNIDFILKNLVLWVSRRTRASRVRALRRCLGIWCLKSQIPSTKLQINLKFQIPNRFKAIVFFVWDFEFRSLFFVCFLGVVIWNFNKSVNFQKSKSTLGRALLQSAYGIVTRTAPIDFKGIKDSRFHFSLFCRYLVKVCFFNPLDKCCFNGYRFETG